MSKYVLSFQTVFILNENIKWLEEFLLYYKHIGFDHFYLYDNAGSSGGDGSRVKNKYGFDCTTTNNDQDILELNRILEKYKDDITYVTWQPRNVRNEIIYGQEESFQHFIKTYGSETEWVAFLDLDEFIFSKNNIQLRDILVAQPTDVSCITITQKKFLDRFLTTEPNITQEYRCIDLVVGVDWAPKNIFRCRDFLGTNTVHTIHVKNKTVMANIDDLRFNHYNVNDVQFTWMRKTFRRQFAINAVDDGMSRYKHLFSLRDDVTNISDDLKRP